jgi:hypothetical protein
LVKCATPILAALALLLGGGLQGRAEMVVENTFGPGDSYGRNSYIVIGSGAGVYTAEAAGFTPTRTTNLSRVRFAVDDANHPPGLGVDVVLAKADGYGNPGNTVETLGIVTPSIWDHAPISTIYTLDSSAHPVLTAGTLYWLILQPDLPGSSLNTGWALSAPAVVGPGAITFSPNGGWSHTNVEPQPAFEILGASGPVASPEPSILVELATAAITGIGYLGWRRRRERSVRHAAPLSPGARA